MACARQAEAQDVAAALELETSGRLRDALDAFESALESPGNSRGDLVVIYAHLGILRFGTGNESGTRQALHRLFAVAPDAELPASAPPELQAIFDDVREVWGARRLHAVIEAPDHVEEGSGAALRVYVADDVAGIVAGTSLLADDRRIVSDGGAGPYTLSMPPSTFDSDRFEGQVELVDSQGGTVWRSEPITIDVREQTLEQPRSTGGSTPIAGDSGPIDHSSRGRGLRIAGAVILGAGVLLGVGGGVLLWLDDEPTGATRIVGDRVQNETYSTAIAGWIGVGLAAAAVTTALVLLLIGRPRPETESLALRLARGTVAQW